MLMRLVLVTLVGLVLCGCQQEDEGELSKSSAVPPHSTEFRNPMDRVFLSTVEYSYTRGRDGSQEPDFSKQFSQEIVRIPMRDGIHLVFPEMFKEIKYDLLIYLKHGEEAKNIFQEFKRTEFYNKRKVIEFIYGTYKKRHLYNAARASRVCLYLSYGETGGMASEEIMSCGCPIVSMKRDTPLGINKKTVNWVSEKREIPEIIQAIRECEKYVRLEVRNTAIDRFNIDKCVEILLANLKEINNLQNERSE